MAKRMEGQVAKTREKLHHSREQQKLVVVGEVSKDKVPKAKIPARN